MLEETGDLTMSASDLILRDDELHGIRIIRVWDGVLKQANCTNNLAYFPDFSREVGWVADDDFGLCDLFAWTDTGSDAILIDDFIDWFIQHVRPAKDRWKSTS
jgi:hypothetical protein